MALSNVKNTNIRLLFVIGVDEDGRPMYKGKTYNNIDPKATADQLMAFSKVIASLSSLPLDSVERTDKSEIIEE